MSPRATPVAALALTAILAAAGPAAATAADHQSEPADGPTIARRAADAEQVARATARAASLAEQAEVEALCLRDGLVERQRALVSEHGRLLARVHAIAPEVEKLMAELTRQRRIAAAGALSLVRNARGAAYETPQSARTQVLAAGLIESSPTANQELERLAQERHELRRRLSVVASERAVLDSSAAALDGRIALARDHAREQRLLAAEAERRRVFAAVAVRRSEALAAQLVVASAASLAATARQAPPSAPVARVGKPAFASPGLPLVGLDPAAPRSRVVSGTRPLPIVGTIAERFGSTRGGLRQRGVMLVTERAQPVTAPRAGSVAFAGPLRRLGLVLIIDHGNDYHSLLSGMSRLDVKEGDAVTDGQQVGWLATDSGDSASLYLEVRRAGEPVDPLPALAVHEDKVRG